MYSPAGLEFWEIVAVSAMCAVAMLAIASLIGATVGYLFFREPKAIRQVATVHGETPAAVPTVRPGYASPAAG
jgi:ABC-type sulfate transport system permease component